MEEISFPMSFVRIVCFDRGFSSSTKCFLHLTDDFDFEKKFSVILVL